MSPREQFVRLVEALRLVASEYAVQVDTFPHFVHVPDEIALTLEDTCAYANELESNGLLNQAQKSHLMQLDSALDRMSADEALWTWAALQNAREWAEVRLLAEQVLEELGQQKQAPQLFWLTFVPGKEKEWES